MQDPMPLKPKQLLALEVLVAGGTDLEAARAAGCGRSSIYRWKRQDHFAGELQHRTLDATESARRILGADMRASVEVSMLATNKLRDILTNPAAPPWMQLQAAQSAKRNGRFAAEKLDPAFRSLEAIGRNDPQRQQAADDLTRRIAVWKNRDRTLNELQEYEQRRLDERAAQLDSKLLRRVNIAARHNPQQRAWLYAIWRREDDHEQALEEIRREKARVDFAAAAGVDTKDLPPAKPFRWADLSKDFEDFIQSAKPPKNEAEEVAEFKRQRELEYINPDTPEGKAEIARCEARLKQVAADYVTNVMPQIPSSPMAREAATNVPSVPKVPSVSTEASRALRTRRKKWRGPIPDQDSPEREAYVNSLGDDEVPELSKSDRARKADWDARRKRSEENERLCAKSKEKKDCA